MTESNLAANLLSESETSHARYRHFEVEVNPTHSAHDCQSKIQEFTNQQSLNQESDRELIRLRQDLADLKQQYQQQELAKETETQFHLKSKERYKREIKNLKLELSNTESTAQALQRSLQIQLQHNWEQQQHELMTSIAKLRALDLEQIISQKAKILELSNQKLLLEKTQQKLTNSLEAAMLELAQTTKALQKTTIGNRDTTKNISLQAVLEQSIRSLQNEYTNSQNRVKDLEDRVGELQEQILKQSGQAVEYEAAVQNWKEKSTIYQNQVIQLSIALEKFIDGKDIPKLMEPADVNLPAFLVSPRT